MREACSGRFTLTAVIHSARSWRVKLLHSRRIDGSEQRSSAVAGCPNMVMAAKARLTKRQVNIPRDDRDGEKRGLNQVHFVYILPFLRYRKGSDQIPFDSRMECCVSRLAPEATPGGARLYQRLRPHRCGEGLSKSDQQTDRVCGSHVALHV